MSAYRVVLAAVALLFVSQISFSEAHQCYQQNCQNCRNTTQVGSPGDCNLNNFVNAAWLQSGGFGGRSPLPNLGTAGLNPVYSCLKFVSKDKNNANVLPHQLRGCAIGTPEEVAIQCAGLVIQQQTQGRTGECFTCTGNLCNSGVTNGPILPVMLIGVLSKLASAMF